MKTYNNDELTIVFLTRMGVSRKKINDILDITTNIYHEFSTKIRPEIEKIIGEEKLKKVKEADLDKTIAEINKFLNEKEISLSTCLSEDFPDQLNEINPRPVTIYYKGDLSILKIKHLLGIVGTRKPTSYGRFVTNKFSTAMANAGVVTVSGLAYGIDSEVARCTVEAKGKTVAVLGGGLCQIYPSSNIPLANKIVEMGGVVISEYFPTDRPTQYTFPDRNRIISGLSNGVLVIEAGVNSGSLITARHAIDQGKDLFVVPGNIDSPAIEGSNALIDELPDTITISPDKILNTFHIQPGEVEDSSSNLSEIENLVLMALSTGIKTTDDLCEILKEDYKTANLLLTEMELSGIIRKLPGDHYCRNI